MMNRTLALAILFGLTSTSGCVEGEAPGAAGEGGAAGFITMLGDDTLAVESFARTANGMTADVVLRTPQTSIRHYEIDLNEAGELVRFEAEVRAVAGDTAGVEHAVATPEGDSLRIQITEGGHTEEEVVAAGPDALPFIDMVHWPFEIMLTRARTAAADSLIQPLFSGGGTLDFVVRDLGEDSMTITHPFRGTMGVDVDADGRLQRLDAAQTTRKLTVVRVPEADVEAVAQQFAAHDAEGRSFGPLSGRGEATADIGGARIAVDYGQPSKRGREIFGRLVPWGELWRTGANRATHFSTTRPLRLGGEDGIEVPAGEYTLYTIPQPDGGTLIVNRQTGQGGTTYDEDRDLGRVEMQRSDLPETVEDFTIVIEEVDGGGALKLQWDRTEFSVPFTVE